VKRSRLGCVPPLPAVQADPSSARCGTLYVKDVSALFEYREGNVWAGRGDELERIRDRAFLAYESERYCGEQEGGPIHADAQGRIWAALGNHGLYKLRNDGQKEMAISNLGKDEAYSITGDGESLWIGRKSWGLTHLVFRDGVWSTRTYTQADGLPQDSIYAVHQSRDGTIWAGTLTSGVIHFDNGHLLTYNMTAGLVSPLPCCLRSTASPRIIWDRSG
jgi:ligand-binding sensor domain-containing protein